MNPRRLSKRDNFKKIGSGTTNLGVRHSVESIAGFECENSVETNEIRDD